METLQELRQFLEENTRLDVKNEALQHILGLTGTPEGRLLFQGNGDLLTSILRLGADWSCESIAKDACLALVNLSADQELVSTLLDLDPVQFLLKCILEKDSPVADPVCMLACNLTRGLSGSERLWEGLENSGENTINHLVAAFSDIGHNSKGANLHYLAPLFSNLSQLPSMRRFLMDEERYVVQRLLPFTQYEDSSVRRGGIIGTLRNCCFDTENHSWLLGPSVELLPALLLPLAGPETYPDEEMEQLPVDLQYLGDDKKREPDPDLRCMLLEAVHQFCVLRTTRELVRNQGTYFILRELHKWEKDRAALLACENLVDLLIQTEDEIGVDDLRSVTVPDDLIDKFRKMDSEFLKEEENDAAS